METFQKDPEQNCDNIITHDVLDGIPHGMTRGHMFERLNQYVMTSNNETATTNTK